VQAEALFFGYGRDVELDIMRGTSASCPIRSCPVIPPSTRFSAGNRAAIPIFQ
jgi:hypothetical protein